LRVILVMVGDRQTLLTLLTAYAIALVLTAFSKEEVVAVAWDSAGVTTGPVTVPLVVALGLGISRGMGVGDGFGILSCASVSPIIFVLISAMLRRRVKP